MPSSIESLFWISACGVLAPMLAGMVPRRLIPEVVLLLAGGVLIGPSVLDLATTDEAIAMLRELGLAMLFLLAGYEIVPSELAGKAGRQAVAVWGFSLALALALTTTLEFANLIDAEIAVAIAMTSTALGTLLPILKDNGLVKSRVGTAVLRHGAIGEVGPVIAIAVLLGVRGPVISIVTLLVFAAICVLVSLPSTRVRDETSQILRLIRQGSETTGQIPVRLTVFLLVGLVAVAAAFSIDTVLASFAAGFILRRAVPDGNEPLETRLEAIGFGFFIPVFFVTSGMAIDPDAIVEEPISFLVFFLLLLLVRGVPVYLVTRYRPPSLEGHAFDGRESSGIGLFAATGLPIIVAVTSVAVAHGQMTATNASVLVAAGALSVLVFPMSAILTLTRGSEPAPTPPATAAERDDPWL